jgi:hypothetical protein
MTDLVLIVPPGVPDQPTRLDVGTGGPPGDERPATVIGYWPGAAAVSWANNRPHDWLRVLEAIDDLEPEPFDGDQESHTRQYDVGVLLITHLPRVGVTVMQLHGLEQTAVLVAAGKQQAPEHVRVMPVEG